jgi:signal transduction histidine kinase
MSQPGTSPPPVEERVEDILDRMTDAFLAVDDEWAFTYLDEDGLGIVSEATGEEHSVEDLQGRHIWETLPQGDESGFEEALHEVMETGEPTSVRMYYEPLDTWFEVRAYPVESGVSVYLEDVTADRQRRRELANREAVLREIYDVIADRERPFEAQVEALLEIGQRELDTDWGTLARVEGDDYVFEVLGSQFGPFEEGDRADLEMTYCEEVVEEQEGLCFGDVEAERQDLTGRLAHDLVGITCYLGTPVIVDDEVYGTFCFYGTDAREGKFSEWEVALVDIMGRWTSAAMEQKLAEDRLRDQNQRLEEFATIVSHDLRNPLEVASNRLALAAEDCESEQLVRIRDAHERMETLIDDVLTMAQAGNTVDEVSAVDAGAVARSAWETVPTDGASLTVVDEFTLQADESRLLQLFENLFRNALEHGSEDAAVTVGATSYGFYVEDDGPGIPPDDRADVFEFGHTSTEEGTGVGLAVVEQVAHAHGWTVNLADADGAGADGEEGVGARFEFKTT